MFKNKYVDKLQDINMATYIPVGKTEIIAFKSGNNEVFEIMQRLQNNLDELQDKNLFLQIWSM